MTARSVSDLAADVERGLIAARDFLNRLPLSDGASLRAKEREFVGVKLVPEALVALAELVARLAKLETLLQAAERKETQREQREER